jgi:hypothetical protein
MVMDTEKSVFGGDVRVLQENSKSLFLITGVDHTGSEKQFSILKTELEKIHKRGSNVKLAQFLGIVVPGLVLVQHIFQGLKRPLCVGNDMEADKTKLAYSWRPEWDFWWQDRYKFDERRLEFREAPDGKVFVVNVSPNRSKQLYPTVDYWIERWYWVRRSDTLLKAPTDWERRYDRQLK